MYVSMKSGLEGRNNERKDGCHPAGRHVSMKSGLEGRNNSFSEKGPSPARQRLNEVRPRRPEQ